jgi:MFS family permease
MKSDTENTPRLLQQEKRNLALLGVCQALLLTIGATSVALNGLAGYVLATNKALATLPVTAWIVGGAMAVFPASMLMKRLGRRGGFAVGTLVGFVGVTVCITALAIGEFWLLCLGAMIFGGFNGFGQLYRFAAADAVGPQHKEKAISLVLAGGVIGGLLGPQLSNVTVDLFSVRYMGAYVAIYGFLVLNLVTLRFLSIPPPSQEELHGATRPLAAIVAQPKFVIGVLCAAMSYGVMNLLMTATPLAMAVCGHSFPATTSVIGWHVVGMFAPSFITGSLIKRFGLSQVLMAGVVLLFSCIGVALSGISVAHFWWTNVLVGVGWNFLYIGGTTLVTETYRPAEKAKAQGANDAAMFLTLVASSLSSGYLLEANGWHLLSYFAIPLVIVAGGAVMALMFQQRRMAPV